MPITGECFCGDVKYEVDGKLFDGRSCHCSRCRKAFSAQASACAMVEPDEFRWTAGEDQVTHYVSQQGAALLFCGKCGSTLGASFDGAVQMLTLGCLNGDPEVTIARHIFVGSKASWEVISPQTDGVPHYEEYPPE